VAWYDFAELRGNTVYDLSGYGNHGTIYGPVWTRGPLIGCLSFDGVDDYVRVPYSAVLYAWKDNNPCTFEVLVRPDFDIPPPEVRVILQYMDDVGTGRSIINVDTNGEWCSVLGGVDLRSGVSALKGVYAHLILRYDGAILKWYVNGDPATEDTRTVDEGKVGDMLICTHKGFTMWWKGNVALGRVYNRALAEREIKAHHRYLSQRFVMHPSLVL